MKVVDARWKLIINMGGVRSVVEPGVVRISRRALGVVGVVLHLLSALNGERTPPQTRGGLGSASVM